MTAEKNERRPYTQEEIERWVLENCRGLGLQADGMDSDFFVIGGTSLAAMKLSARAEQEFGENALPPGDLYGNSSLQKIASLILKNR